MLKYIRKLLTRPVLKLASRFSSKPRREKIFEALSKLADHILAPSPKKGVIIPFNEFEGKFIIFSDQHKGRRNGADDFILAEPNYLAALDYYNQQDFCFINLGDSEELWENTLWQVRKKNKATFAAEKKFLDKNKYVKVFGNHDLYWNTSPLAALDLYTIYGKSIKVYDGVILQTNIAVNPGTSITKSENSITEKIKTNPDANEIDHSPLPVAHSPLSIFLTHGHQGDAQSDGNWFIKFFVGWIWAPLQALLRINPNTPAYDAEKKTLHNNIMYDWSSAQENMMLITGHTHQPVFASLTHLERLYKDFQLAESEKNAVQLAALLDEIKKREKEFTAVSADYMKLRPSYFNTGCCCFSDGDITGIEIAEGKIRLIKWCLKEGVPDRNILEEAAFSSLMSKPEKKQGV